MKKLAVAPPEAYLTGIQPSMSRSELLLECSWWIGKRGNTETSAEPARYGSAFHEVIARIIGAKWNMTKLEAWIGDAIKTWGVEAAHDELHAHLTASIPTLRTWLEGLNEYKYVFTIDSKSWIETAMALMPLETGRMIDAHDEDHRYRALVMGELAGTGDLIIPKRGKVPLLILDHKTGEEDFSRPLEKAQLLSLAAAAMRITKVTECIVGAFHARRRGMPKIYTERVTLAELRGYERRIQAAMNKAGDGSMRPGPWCGRCPAQSACPAQDAQLFERAGDILTGLTAAGGALSAQGLSANDVTLVKAPAGAMTREKQLGTLYSVVRKAEAIADRAREEIRKEVIASKGRLLPVTPEGEYLTIRSYDKENLSKTSLLKAYGKVKSEKMIAKLREDGAITVSHVEQLYPEKERGGRP